MHLVARYFAGVVIFIAALKSAAFGWFLGPSTGLSILLAVMHFALDGFKVFLAPITARAWSTPDQTLGRAVAGTVLMTVLVAWGFGSAVGIAAKARFETSGSRATDNRAFDTAQAEIKRLEGNLTTPAPRKVGEIDADLTTLKAKRVEGKTVQERVGDCTDLTSPTARRYCPDIKRLDAERASSEKWFQDEAALARLRGSREAVIHHSTTDPQADVFSRVTGLPLEMVQLILMIAFGVIVELVGSLGLIATAEPPARRKEAITIEPDAQPVATVTREVQPPVAAITAPESPPAVEAPPAPETSKPLPKRKVAKRKRLSKAPTHVVRFPKPVIRRTGVGAPTVLRHRT